MTPRDTRKQQEAVIVFACFVMCFVVIPVLALASTQFRIYAPAVRNWLLAAVGA